MRYEIDKKSKAHEKMVVVTFYNGDGIIEKVEDKYIIDNEVIYKEIAIGNKVNLDNCYVEKFSMIDCKKFIKEYYSEVDIDNIQLKLSAKEALFNHFADFTEATFSGEAIFWRAIFLSIVNFKEASFTDEVDFTGVTFSDNAHFQKVTFSRKAIFEATFSGKADFFEATFLGEADFAKATFLSVADFWRVTFSREAIFMLATILHKAIFLHATFSGKADFFEATFSGKADFTSVTFYCEANFKGATFLDKVDFNAEHCACLYLHKSIIEKRINICGNIKTLNLVDADFGGKIGLDWEVAKGKDMINSQDDTNYYEKAEQFVLLKENYNKQGKYDYEDKAYYEFKKCMQKSKIRGELLDRKYKKFFNYIWEGLWYIPKLFIFQLIGGYGTKPRNVFFTMILTVIGFALAYLYMPILEIDLSDINFNDNEIVSAIYYSGITFLTIGYGDISPLNACTAVVSVIEGFLGIFLMAYFTVSFVRKLLR